MILTIRKVNIARIYPTKYISDENMAGTRFLRVKVFIIQEFLIVDTATTIIFTAGILKDTIFVASLKFEDSLKSKETVMFGFCKGRFPQHYRSTTILRYEAIFFFTGGRRLLR